MDAVARGEIGNSEAAHCRGTPSQSRSSTPRSSTGGFTVDAENTELLGCLDDFLDWLTDGRQIGFPDWQADRSVFMKRAKEWSPPVS